MRQRALAMAASLFFASVPAAAQTADQLSAARAWFGEGVKHEKAGAWEQAIERFERALRVKKTPQLYLHVGYCREQLDQLVEARAAYERAHELARSEANEDALRVAVERAAALARRLPMLHIAAPQTARNLRVWVDGVPLSADELASPLPVNPGSHRVRATADGSRTFERRLNMREGDAQHLELELVPLPKEKNAAPADDAPSWPGFLLVGAGVAAIGGGLAMLIVALEEDADVDDRCGGSERPTCPESQRASIESDIERINGLQVGAAVLSGAGVACVAVGTWLLVSHGDGAPVGAWWIAPAVAGAEAGMSAGLRF